MLQVTIIMFGIAAVAMVLWVAMRRQRRGFREGDVADLFEAVEVRVFIIRAGAAAPLASRALHTLGRHRSSSCRR